MPEGIKKVESSKSEETQQTEKQNDPPTEEGKKEVLAVDPAYVESLQQRIAEQQIANRRLEQLIEKNREIQKNEPPTPRNIEKEREEFYKDPIGRLNDQLNTRDQRILSEFQKMLAPIHEVAANFRVNNQYDRIKSHLKVDPMFRNGLNDPEVENAVDMMMKNHEGEVTEEMVKSAIMQVIGYRSMMGNGSSRRVESERSKIDPPVVPSTATRIDKSAPQMRELTEDDRTAMRYAGLKPGNPEHERQYWELIADDTMVLDVHTKKEK